jgi:hypothetical protein
VSCDTRRIYRTDRRGRRPAPFLEAPDETVVERVVEDYSTVAVYCSSDSISFDQKRRPKT